MNFRTCIAIIASTLVLIGSGNRLAFASFWSRKAPEVKCQGLLVDDVALPSNEQSQDIPTIRRKQDVYDYSLNGPPYKTTWSQYSMEATTITDFGTRVRYYGSKERAQFRLYFDPVNHLILDSEGRPFDTRTGHSEHGTDGVAIFVMDRNGNFYASTKHKRGGFHHSSFLAGQPVAAAGEMGVIEGKIVFLDDRSGHYSPSRYFTAQAIDQLKTSLAMDDVDFQKQVKLNLYARY